MHGYWTSSSLLSKSNTTTTTNALIIDSYAVLLNKKINKNTA